jgi:hypothetical protein
MGQSKFHDKKSKLVAFEYSDTQGYILQFGDGYIHFWKNDGQLFETTTTELEAFTIQNSVTPVAGLMVVEAADSSGAGIDVPSWGSSADLSGSPANNGTIALSNNGSGLVRVTTSVPHTLRTGAKAFFYSSDLLGINGNQYTVTRINGYTLDLQGSTWAALAGTGLTAMYSNGVLAGDRIYISGASNYPEISEKFVIVTNNDSWYQFTINVGYASHGSPTGEEGHIIPIEVITPYSESDLEELRFVQSADVLYIIHPDYPVYKLTRLDNDGDRYDWLFAKVEFKDGPYLPLNSLAPTWDETTPANGTTFRDVYFELSGYTHTATVTSAVGWTASAATHAGGGGDQDGYIEYREGDQWRLAKLPSVLSAGAKTATVTIIDNVLLHLDEATKFTGTKKVKTSSGKTKRIVYNAGSPNLTPTIPGAATQSKTDPNNYVESSVKWDSTSVGTLTSSFSNTFSQSDVGKFVRFFDSGAHGSAGTALSGTSQKPVWAQIARVSPDKGGKECVHEKPAIMAVTNPTGNFEITNHSRTATLKSYKNGAVFSAFKSTDVGRLVRIGWAGRWTWGKITAYTSSSQVSVSLYEDVPRDPHNAANLAGATNGALTASSTTGRSYDWRMGSWSDTTGYPSCGVFHEQRLWFGRTNTEPQAIWGSVSGDFENFGPTELDSAVLEDNAIGFTIASTKANPIKWMTAGPTIVVGTVGAEWQVKSSSVTSEPITPLNIVVVPHTTHGSNSSVQPLRIGNSTMFADRPGNKIRELIYDFQQDGLVSNDITYLSEHILRDGSGAIYSAYQQEPNNLCWFVLNDGTLAAVTINKQQEIVAWHHHTIQDAVVESIAVVPSTGGAYDDVWIAVKRTVSGSAKRTIEKLQPDFNPTSASNRTGMSYLDGIVEMTSHSSSSVYGLHHLIGKNVDVVVNGVKNGTYTVSATGGVSISPTPSNATVTVGLAYESIAKSLPPEGGSMFGTSQGKIKKIAKYNVRLLNSLTLDYGFDANGQSLNSITNLHENGTSTDFYTGTKELIPNNPYDAESQWTLSTSQPYPLNILSVTMTVESGE